jgi:hypothetical protein
VDVVAALRLGLLLESHAGVFDAGRLAATERVQDLFAGIEWTSCRVSDEDLSQSYPDVNVHDVFR